MVQSENSFHYLPTNILYYNSQNSYLVIVLDNCSLFPALFIISFDLYCLVLRLQTEENSPYFPMINMSTDSDILNWFDSLRFQIAC